ncbi:transmembrane protein 138 [Glossina fuscipes]|uniref:Transmembrane protein 138 n=1 Tax=Glossina fuscipes TaxID=7396 RepID=A0A9C5ZHR0_9MUSC|nr:transmembrane protein 138 [Glossina fuscipes]
MKLTLGNYKYILFLQFILLLADLMFNSFTYLITSQKLKTSIFIFLTQDSFIIMEYALFIFIVHATCVYEIGGTQIILRNCKLFLAAILIYFLLSGAQQMSYIYMMMYPKTYWPEGLRTLTCIHRAASLFYYFSTKRTALTLSDPRYYAENIDWIAEQFSNK